MWGSRSDLGYTYSYENRFNLTIDLVRRAAEPPARVLDLAAAQGNFSIALAELGYQVVWNDLRAELIDYVRRKYEFGTLEFLPGNIFNLPIETIGLFDVVLATEIIEHVAHPDEFVKKLRPLLNDGGTIVLTTPNGAYFRNCLPRFSDCLDPSIFESAQFRPNADGHLFLPYADELELWARRAGLEIEQLIIFNNFFTKGHVKTGMLLPLIPKWLVRANERLTRALPNVIQARLCSALAASLRCSHSTGPS